jgi:hypothetical protein
MTMQVPQERTYTLSEFEGWRTHVESVKRPRPEPLSSAQMALLSARDRLVYNEQRGIWHANMGPYLTPGMAATMDDWDLVTQGNRQDGDKVRSSILLDAFPGLGKTTLAVHYASTFHRDQVEIYGKHTDAGHTRVPVAYISLTAKTTIKSLNSALCRFYGHKSWDRGSATELGVRAAICAAESHTRLIVIDDVHFLNVGRADGRDVVNHLKSLASEFQATFLFVGVEVESGGLLTEGLGPARAQAAQVARRWTVTRLRPFEIDGPAGQSTWRRLLKAIERDLVLANKQPGMLADSLDEYLFERTTGHFQSLMSLIVRGCVSAIKGEEEALTVEVLDRVRLDAAAEQSRQRMRNAMTANSRRLQKAG